MVVIRALGSAWVGVSLESWWGGAQKKQTMMCSVAQIMQDAFDGTLVLGCQLMHELAHLANDGNGEVWMSDEQVLE